MKVPEDSTGNILNDFVFSNAFINNTNGIIPAFINKYYQHIINKLGLTIILKFVLQNTTSREWENTRRNPQKLSLKLDV